MDKIKLRLAKVKIGNAIAFIMIFGIFSFVGLLFFVSIPSENKDILNTILSLIVGGCLGAVTHHFFNYDPSRKKEQNEFDLQDHMCPNCHREI